MPRRLHKPTYEPEDDCRTPVTFSAVLLQNGEVQAKTAFLVHRSHLETDHQLLSGREDVLRKGNGALEVARNTTVLDASVLLDKNLSVFLQGLKADQLDGSQLLGRRWRKSTTSAACPTPTARISEGDHESATSLLAPLPRQVFFTEIGAARGTAS